MSEYIRRSIPQTKREDPELSQHVEDQRPVRRSLPTNYIERRIAARDDLLMAADAVLASAGVNWSDNPERYSDLKLAIMRAADAYHAAMNEA